MPSAKNQLSLFPPQPLDHGGEKAQGKRKTARPIDTKRPLHLTFRSEVARGRWSLLHPRNAPHVDRLTRACAKRHGMKLYRFVNVGNQIHLIVQGYSRKHVQAFLRDVTGTLAIAITGARKGQALGHRFWTQLAFSRVISWGREFRRIFAATDFLSAAERTIAAIVTVDPIPKVT